MAWVPNPADPLHGLSELLPISESIYYTPGEFEVIDTYTAAWTGIVPTNIVLAYGSSGIILGGIDVTGLFVIEVDYLLARVPGSVARWPPIPPTCEEIYKYVAPASLTATTTLLARVYLAGGGYYEATYTIEALTDYTIGRDKLIAEVNLRR